jgi:hypothetical protein
MKKLSLFLLLLLSGCYTQFKVVEIQNREVVVVQKGYHTPQFPIYPYSLYRWEYYSRYLTPEYRWYYIYHTPRQTTTTKTTTPQIRRSSGVQPSQRTESGRRVGTSGGSRRDSENVRRGSEEVERTKRPERRVEVTEVGKRENGNGKRDLDPVVRNRRTERKVE